MTGPSGTLPVLPVCQSAPGRTYVEASRTVGAGRVAAERVFAEGPTDITVFGRLMVPGSTQTASSAGVSTPAVVAVRGMKKIDRNVNRTPKQRRIVNNIITTFGTVPGFGFYK